MAILNISSVSPAVANAAPTAIMTAAPSGGTLPYSYQWYYTTVAATAAVQGTTVSAGIPMTGSAATVLNLTAGNYPLTDLQVPVYVQAKVTDSGTCVATTPWTQVDFALVSSAPSTAALTQLGYVASTNGNSVTHQQAGHVVQIFPDITTIPSPFVNAVSVVFKAVNPATGVSFVAPAVTGFTVGSGAYAQYTTTGFDFLTAGTWNVSLQILNTAGTLVNTVTYSLTVA